MLSLLQPAETRAEPLGAAKAVLKIGEKLREMADIEARLAEPEQRLEAEDAMSA